MDYWATPEATEKLMQHLNCGSADEIFKRLHIDKVITVGPRYIGPPVAPNADIYGCRYEEVSYQTGTYRECVYHPLAEYETIEEIEKNFAWPSADWYDYSVLKDQLAGHEESPVQGGYFEPFLIYKDLLRGPEKGFMDLVMNPEMVHYCLDQLYDFCYRQTSRIFETLPGKIDMTYVAEDLGGQETLMFSPYQIQEFFIPRMKKMMDFAHGAGIYVFHHNDGSIRRILPDLIGAGIDVLNPIQWRCGGMERKNLKKDFGDKVVFHGGVDNQQTLSFGAVQEVQKEVLDNLRILGEGGGYILAPCHNIQSVSPPENIVAMYETGFENGWT